MKSQNFLKDKSIVGSPKKHFIALTICLFIFWLFLSGKYEIKFIIYGIITAVVCSYICMPLLHVENLSGTKKYFVFKIPFFRLIRYIIWFCGQLILSNLDVVQAYMHPKMKIDPKIISFRIPMDNPVATTFLAKSITLTPGTVTIRITKDNTYEIHALTENAAEGIKDGEMARKVAKLFGEKDAEFTYLGEVEAQ